MPKVICFRATDIMCEAIDRIMDERLIDRTTVIKLALYHFDTYMRQGKTRSKNLYEIVDDLEQNADPQQMRFASFSVSRGGQGVAEQPGGLLKDASDFTVGRYKDGDGRDEDAAEQSV